MSKIIDRKEVELTAIQKKMVKSGWGEETLENTTVEKITYDSDGLKVKGYLAYPKSLSKKLPCVIWCRGGIGNAGAIDSFNAKGIFGQLASWGYVVLSTQYRGNDGSEGKDEFGGDDLNDIINLKEVAKEIDIADTSIWGIEGWSRGGMMTYLTLTKDHDFKCAVVSGGIANLRCNSDESKFMKKLYEVTMGKYGSETFNQKCESRSIVKFPEKLPKETPILLIHGTADSRVLPHDSLDLAYKLQDHKIPYQLVMLKDGDHFLKSHRKEVDKMRKDWFEKYLK
ncbi:MAG: prolyl oligopeptidase family serine peptidase [Melioribacteraceae bacterium]|nr:prolyl oligopeptidase family serine peptidase [Melioribacteraceae bacterium]